MEVCDIFQGVFNIFQVFPSVSFYTVTIPFDQVLKPLPEHPTVQNLLNDIFFFPIYEFWGWGWRRMSTGDQVWRGQSYFDHIKDWVEAFHQCLQG
jgi:hypothetical protein